MRSRILRTNNPSRSRRLETRARRSTLPAPPEPVDLALSSDDRPTWPPASAPPVVALPEEREEPEEPEEPDVPSEPALSIDPPPVVMSTGDVHEEDDEAATHFFSSPPPEIAEATFATRQVAAAHDLELEPPRRTVPLARRARFMRVVTMSMIACSILCVAAALRVALTKGHSEVHAAARATPVVAPVVVAPPSETASVPVVTAPVEPAAPAVDPRWADAKAATHAALVALEMRRVDKAIEAATAATVLDAADGEAWLVLGAAYQDAGRLGDALNAYKTCRLQGRVDPRGECGAMLRSFTFTGR